MQANENKSLSPIFTNNKFWLSPNSLIIIFLISWSIIQFSFARPVYFIDDWNGWRQAATQSVARNLFRPDSSLFYPQINWGGNGPGYLESELQIYPAMIAIIMKFAGDVEWPGQLLSVIFIALTGLTLFKMLAREFGGYLSLFGTIFFLTSCAPVHLSTSVQPDSLCLLFYTLGLAAFIRFVESETNKHLYLSAICMTLAALIKPTALNLGITQFIFILLAYPKLLHLKRLWASWIVILIIVGLYMAHAYLLYVTYGNTWGVLAGDSKFPELRNFFIPWLYMKLTYMTLIWGIGVFGTIAGLYILLVRKCLPIEWALILGNLAAVFVSWRYTSNRGYGAHYHMYTNILSTLLITHAGKQLLLSKKLQIKTLYTILAFMITIQYGASLYYRRNPLRLHYHPDVTYTGRQLARIARPEDLVIVRSGSTSVSRELWGKRINNFQDPRIFYIAKVRGWSLPSDIMGSSRIKTLVRKGARYYVEPGSPRTNDPKLYHYLQSNSIIVHSSKRGRIYALKTLGNTPF